MTELVARTRQEGFKLVERSGAPTSVRRANSSTVDLDPGRFFTGALSARTPHLVRERTPDECSLVIEGADAASDGRFNLFGYGTLSFGDPIDWHLDPIAQVRAPLKHWSQLDVLDRSQVGDSKVPWELNRHQWLVGLAQAYRLTGEAGYCEVFVRQVRAWLEANPKGRGLNWASSLEVALRLIAWFWALYLFEGAPGVPAAFIPELLDAAADHAAHVERYLSHYYAPNTHLTGEALGLLYAGLLLPGDRRATRWRDRGMRILIEQCERQIAPDGTYCEQSTCYQRYTAEIYLHAMILAARNGLKFPNEVNNRLVALLDQLLWVSAPNGSMPMIGDADGGWLLPLTPRAPDDLRGVFSTAAAWLGRAEYAAAADGLVAPETLWLLGEPGLESFMSLIPCDPSEPPSRLFADGALAVMRPSWRRDAHQLVFDAAPLARFGHAHADLLAVQCAAFGQPCLVDAGTYCYAADRSWRDFFRGTSAHNTVVVDDLGQAEPARPFSWKARPAARLRAWRSSDEFDFADAEHDAYLDLPDPVVHRRRVLFVKPRYWLLVDDLTGSGSHRVALRFQFSPLEVTTDLSGWTRAEGADGHGLLVRLFSSAELALRLHTAQSNPPAGWISPDYGRREPAPMLVCSTDAQVPLRIVTLVLPARDVSEPPPSISEQRDHRGAVCAIRFQEAGETVRINDELAWVDAASTSGAG